MDGFEVLDEVRLRRPNLAVALISGFSDRADLATELGVPLLPKPFDRTQLARFLAGL
ncbi:MAG: hypothetical protein AAF493_15055 [Pseudomonadota bacterium]